MSDPSIVVIRDPEDSIVVSAQETTVVRGADQPAQSLVSTTEPVMTVTPVEPYVTIASVGAQGPPGPIGGVYTHVQAAPSDEWTIVHGLGYRPAGIHVEDTQGSDIEGDVEHVNANTVILRFSYPFGGTAYLS